MAKGEVREYSDEAALADLLSAGYVKKVRADPKKKKSPPKKECEEK